MTNPPKTWLTESILATLLCCLPLGIMGIIQANKVSKLIDANDEKAARRESETAKVYVIVSAVLGVVVYFFAAVGVLVGD